MKKIKSLLVILTLTSLFHCTQSNEADLTDVVNPDKEAIERAVLDYAEALYNADSTLVYRGVSRGLSKIGVGTDSKETTSIEEGRRDFQGLVQLANDWNKDQEVDPSTAIKEVIIYDISSHTASTKLLASWGIDYIHLGKYDDQWKIVNVIYQGYPDDE